MKDPEDNYFRPHVRRSICDPYFLQCGGQREVLRSSIRFLQSDTLSGAIIFNKKTRRARPTLFAQPFNLSGQQGLRLNTVGMSQNRAHRRCPELFCWAKYASRSATRRLRRASVTSREVSHVINYDIPCCGLRTTSTGLKGQREPASGLSLTNLEPGLIFDNFKNREAIRPTHSIVAFINVQFGRVPFDQERGQRMWALAASAVE